ncbi:CpaF family protein [Neomegalonema sp.]|uniref:CpaF family protein n=1 Tax=Neomegalonema sp. TaxID=2039713 RepID=UPI00260D2911|nr:CpaF family protein [Neomegalonema sp.]MDD2868839.1 CpaF family protein [Neomegalonema sp.]
MSNPPTPPKMFGRRPQGEAPAGFGGLGMPTGAPPPPRRSPPPPPPRPGMKAPPPPGPAGAGGLGGLGPRIKPKPTDALNMDLSRSRPPPGFGGPAGAPPPRPGGPRPGGVGPGPIRPEAAAAHAVEEESGEVVPVGKVTSVSLAGDSTPSSGGGFGALRAKARANKKTPAMAAAEEEAKAAATERSRGDPIHTQEYYALKTDIFSALIDAMDLSRVVALSREDAENEISTIINEIVAVKGFVLSVAEQRRLVDDICDDVLGYGPLEPLLERDDIADIMVNGADQVYIETKGKIELTNIRFRDNRQLLEICQRIVSKVGRRVDESSPICDARLLDGSRVNVIAPPLAIDGPTLTIRKFKKDKLKMADLVRFGAITPEGAKVLEIAAASRCNILISGGTGSGKTTLLNCLSGFSADDERIITCEDSAELQLQQPHVVRLETRPSNLEGKGEVTMRDLVKNCLRMRPERIIVGEVRGPEAFDLLQAMNTGHDGSMGTLHANSPRECLSRLESMITMGGFALPSKTIREMICSAVNVIVQAQRLRDGSRRITHVSEVLGMEGETIITQDIVRFKVTGENAQGKLVGKHLSTGVGQPAFWERAQSYNREVELQGALTSMDEDLS